MFRTTFPTMSDIPHSEGLLCAESACKHFKLDFSTEKKWFVSEKYTFSSISQVFVEIIRIHDI